MKDFFGRKLQRKEKSCFLGISWGEKGVGRKKSLVKRGVTKEQFSGNEKLSGVALEALQRNY